MLPPAQVNIELMTVRRHPSVPPANEWRAR